MATLIQPPQQSGTPQIEGQSNSDPGGTPIGRNNFFNPRSTLNEGPGGGTTLINNGIDSILNSRMIASQNRHEAFVLGPEGSTNLEQKARAGETRGASFLKDSMVRGRGFEAAGEGLRRQHEANVANTGRATQRLRAGANFAAQAKGGFKFGGGPRGFSRQLTQAERRGKARLDITSRGEKTIKNQQLKDRLALIKSSVNKRGLMADSAANAATLEAAGESARLSAQNQSANAFTGAVGAVAGGAIRGFGDKFFDDTGDLGQGIMDQQSELDMNTGQDFGVDNTFGQGFDFSGGGGSIDTFAAGGRVG